MKPKRPSVGRIVHFWSLEGTELRNHAAIVVRVSEQEIDRCFLHVFWASGFGGRDTVWAPCAPYTADGTHTPTDGHWTWPVTV